MIQCISLSLSLFEFLIKTVEGPNATTHKSYNTQANTVTYSSAVAETNLRSICQQTQPISLYPHTI